MLVHDDLIEYTDYNGPKHPKDGDCFCVNTIKDFYGPPGTGGYDTGHIFYLKYSLKDNAYFFHRENNKPCVVSPTGTVEYRIDERFHRTNGPALLLSDEDALKMNIPSQPPIWGYKGSIFQKEENYWIYMLDKENALP